ELRNAVVDQNAIVDRCGLNVIRVGNEQRIVSVCDTAHSAQLVLRRAANILRSEGLLSDGNPSGLTSEEVRWKRGYTREKEKDEILHETKSRRFRPSISTSDELSANPVTIFRLNNLRGSERCGPRPHRCDFLPRISRDNSGRRL